MKLIWYLFPVMLLMIACGKEPVEKVETREAKKIVLTKAQEEVRNGVNVFGVEMFRHLYAAGKGRNLVYSPLGLSLSLSMAAQGAAGSTWTQFADVLNWSKDAAHEDVAQFYRTMISGLSDADPAVRFASSNSIWTAKGFSIQPEYKRSLSDFYAADSYTVDFSAHGTLDMINDWVSNKTDGMIERMIESLNGKEQLLTFNALVFNGPWRLEAEKVGKDRFYGRSGNSRKDYISFSDIFYFNDVHPDFVLFRLPYGNGAFDLTVLLPNEDKSLDDIVAGLEPSFFNTLSFGVRDGEIRIPMFSVSWDGTEDVVKTALNDMGLVIPFQPNADFSGIHQGIYITDVLQRTHIELTDKGTDLSSVTEVRYGDTGAPQKPVSVTANRPFLYCIRETSSNAILFIGVLSQ